MSTTTTNLGLVKPEYSDTADVQVINQNMDKIDGATGGVMGSLAVVANGNTHAAIVSGQYAYVKNHSSLAEGLYIAKSAISVNGTLSASNMASVSDGGLNHLSKYVTLFYKAYGMNYDETATLSESITNFRYLLLVFRTNYEYATQLIPTDTIPVGSSISQSFLEHNVSEGQVTYPLSLSASTNVMITSATTFKCTMQVYSNSNLKARLMKVIGIGRVNY